MPMSKKVRRLYEGFQPDHYTLQLEPDKETMLLSGSVIITGKKTGRPSQRLTLHRQNLKITSAKITKHDKKGDIEFVVDRINHHGNFEEVRLHSNSMMYPGNYTVSLNFKGKINRQMEGIYPCFFKIDDQEKKLMATQFESHHAREAFPCIDEPEAKATFDLTLITPSDETVIGNTAIKKQTKSGAKKTTEFETTPKMSTYLLAFVFGDLKYKEAKTKSGIKVRAYATPNNVDFTEFALNEAVKYLNLYEEYFDIPYPLSKCDFVALPDFAAGAMENWGCITFREHALLVDPQNTGLPTKQYVATVVAHELAHMWFGDLVTMRWWTDLWLNEGFATWMEYFAPDKYYPEWNLWTQYLVDEQQPGMRLDALQNTHPVQVTINHPDEIRSIFDYISYNKGGSSLQMLATYLGQENFRDGLRHYLKKFAYGNTDTNDLWESLELVSGKPVQAFMNKWVSIAGFPVVKADVKDGSVSLRQEQFLLNPLSRKKLDEHKTWPIPLRSNTDLPDIFDQKSAEYKFNDKGVLKLNREHSGFYRVVYNSEHVAKLTDLVKSNELGPLDRLGMLSDYFESAKAGYISTLDALKLLNAYENEDNNAVWDVIAVNIASIRSEMKDEQLRKDMKPFVRNFVSKQLHRLGWEAKDGESYFDSLLRPTILAMASVSDEQSVTDRALKLFKKMDKPEDLHPDIRDVVYVTAARHGDKKDFEKMLKMHNESTNAEDRTKLVAGITDFSQPELINKALSVITTDAVRHQDVVYWLVYSISNRHAKKRSWEWLKANWSWLHENLGNDFSFSRLPVYASRVSSDDDFKKDYVKFFESVMQPILERTFRQGIENIEWQSEWKKRDLEIIKKFFADSSK